MDIFKILLIIHIGGGSIAFIVAPVAMAVKKGGQHHRRWGKVFFWSMTVVASTAIIMAPMHDNLFLTLVAVFSFYLAFSGYRSIYRKASFKNGKTAAIDWIFAILNSLFSVSLLIFGLMGLPQAFGIISVVFGTLGSLMSLKDIISFIRPSDDKHKWLYSHMTGMIAAYIAAVSAFSAVNLNFDWLPAPVQWLWPTVIGVPLMRTWINSYKTKFSRGKKIENELILRKPPEVELEN